MSVQRAATKLRFSTQLLNIIYYNRYTEIGCLKKFTIQYACMVTRTHEEGGSMGFKPLHHWPFFCALIAPLHNMFLEVIHNHLPTIENSWERHWRYARRRYCMFFEYYRNTVCTFWRGVNHWHKLCTLDSRLPWFPNDYHDYQKISVIMKWFPWLPNDFYDNSQ